MKSELPGPRNFSARISTRDFVPKTFVKWFLEKNLRGRGSSVVSSVVVVVLVVVVEVVVVDVVVDVVGTIATVVACSSLTCVVSAKI